MSHIIKFFFFTIIIAQASCQSSQQQEVVIIDAEKLKELKVQDVQLIDVRTPGEYAEGRIEGALLMDFLNDDFDDKVSALDKSKPVMIYCGVGGRSKKASQRLKNLGFETVYDYSGGFRDWKSRGEAIEQ